ncbi:hypothetical protein NKI38_24545 [Mesorhizobium sp. M0621]|uniref:GTP pyrophosphokinase n=1 Tax=Mesorhizobium sp. M0621 TaxID=2956974 RepID=UPI0033351C3D
MDHAARMISDFKKSRRRYLEFTKESEHRIKSLMNGKSIEYLAIEKRTKDLASFSKKVTRPDKIGKYEKYTDITDLSGIRIIAYYQKDVDAICRLIKSWYEIDLVNSIDKTQASEPDRFGYASIHYIASYGSARDKLPEYVQFAGMKLEIQVRTLLQHTWAALDRRLRYGNDSAVPIPIKRKLYRVSAMLEGVDEDLTDIERRVVKLREEYAEGVKAGKLQVAVNKDSLEVFLEESSTVKKLVSAARRSGLHVPTFTGQIDEEDQRYNRLLPLLRATEIDTIQKLDATLNDLVSSFAPIFDLINQRKIPRVTLSVYALIRMLLYFSRNDSVRDVAIRSGGFIGKTRGRIDDAYRQLTTPPAKPKVRAKPSRK